MEATCYENKPGCQIRGEHYHEDFGPSLRTERLVAIADEYGETLTSLDDPEDFLSGWS